MPKGAEEQWKIQACSLAIVVLYQAVRQAVILSEENSVRCKILEFYSILIKALCECLFCYSFICPKTWDWYVGEFILWLAEVSSTNIIHYHMISGQLSIVK